MSRFIHKFLTASALAAGAMSSGPGAVFADDQAKPKDDAPASRRVEAGEKDRPEAKPDAKPEAKPEAKRPDAPRADGPRPEGPRPEVGDLFKKLDADGDGNISESDVPEEHRRMFDRLLSENDKNKDGKLNLDEFRSGLMEDRRRAEAGREGAQPGPARGIEPGEVFKRMDRNGDGKLTAEDLPEESRGRFKGFAERVDANKDGAISEEEFRKAPRPGGGPGRDGGLRREGAPNAGEPRRDGPPREGAPRDGEPRREGEPREGGPFQGGPRVGMAFPVAPIMAAIDSNRDGEISAEELAASSSELRKLDKDGDGKLSRQEIMPRFEGRYEGRGEGRPDAPRTGEFIKSRDADGDGKISREEATDRMKENFDRIDANKDGQIDEAELRQMFAGPGRPEAGTPREGRRPDAERGPDAKPRGEGDRPAERKPDGEPRRDVDRKPDGPNADKPRDSEAKKDAPRKEEKRDGEKREEVKRDEPKREEAAKDRPAEKSEKKDVERKDGERKKDEASKKDDLPSK
jgi:Ca2+-binding EF-hand superfamily protein